MDSLTGGAFLVAFALLLGASNTVVGLLAAVSPLMQLFQIPAVHLVERSASRKALVVRNSVLSRISWLIIAVIPWLVAPEKGYTSCLCVFFSFSAWGPFLPVGTILGYVTLSRKILWGGSLASPWPSPLQQARMMALAAGAGIEMGKSHVSGQFVPYSVLFLLGGIVGLSGSALPVVGSRAQREDAEAPRHV